MNTKALPFHRHLRHPRTGQRIRALGRRQSGRLIWPIMGGDGTDDDKGGGSDDGDKGKGGGSDDDKSKGTGNTDDDKGKGSSGGQPDKWAQLFADQTPEAVKEALENSRKWEGRAKGNKDKADKFDQLVAALTGGDDDAEKDPEKLAADLNSARSETSAVKIENAVLRGAGAHSADGAMLVDSRSFMETVLKLDPSADDFGTKLSDAIKSAVEKNPSFQTTGGGRPKPTRQQGNPSEGKESGVAAGRAMFESSRKRTTAAT